MDSISSDQPVHLLDWSPDRLSEWFASSGQPAYRARQVFEWIYRHLAESFEQMTSLSKGLRAELQRHFIIDAAQLAAEQQSSDGTTKLLLEWPDHESTECVLIPEPGRHTACISSQVGCPVRCVFCASGLNGLERNLTAGQIVEQALRIRRRLGAEQRLSNVVLMGLGEPLANYDNVLRAVRTLNADWGMNVAARRITISTIGLPPQIRRLADEGLQVNLAISVHAANDALRGELVPWAKKARLSQLVSAGRYWFAKTGRELTLEYVLLAGVNDHPEHAEQLAHLAHKLRCNLNLIRYHPVEGLPYRRPTSRGTARFQSLLRGHGVNAHTRTSRGLDIDAACGQLRRRERPAANP